MYPVFVGLTGGRRICPVSYTHLDVYKRQVQVCPTGIDIRDGLQNECIGCAACIDVCNDVMVKMDYPKGLIRYSTENGVVHGWSKLQMFRRALRPRVLIYGGLLSAASVAFAASVALRSPFQVCLLYTSRCV